MTLTYAELFAGAGGLSLGLETAGWQAVAHAEIEPHARAVLREHWPECRLDGDVSAINGADYAGVTLLSGGFPCQDVSVAGKRAGLAGARTGLFYEATRIIGEAKPLFVLLENVMGLVSSNNGDDIEAVLAELGRLGYLVECEELDAQNFGVPQRRRRVFFVCVAAAEALGISGRRLTTTFCESTRANVLVAGLRFAWDVLTTPSHIAQQSSAFGGSLPVRGLTRTINTFANLPEQWGWSNWPRIWIETSASSASDAGTSASPLAVPGTPTPAATDPIGGSGAESAARRSSIARLWSALWGDLSTPASASTISTWSRTTTDLKISMCAEMSVLISEHTAAWTDSSPHYWSAVSLCLTALPESIAYLRTQTDDLFVAEDWREHAWLLLARAERVQLDLIERARTGGVDPAEVLAVGEGLCGDSPAGAQAGQNAPRDARNRAGAAGEAGGRDVRGVGDDGDPSYTLGQVVPGVLTYDARGNGDGATVNTMAGDHQNRVTDYTAIVLRNREGKPGGGKGPLLSAERERTLGTGNDQVLFVTDGQANAAVAKNVALTLNSTNEQPYLVHPTLNTSHFGKHAGCNQHVGELAEILPAIGIPRRLMPIECERLMGWEDGWTAYGVSEDGTRYALSDTARYRLCGNGVASPVAAWIGWRLRWALSGAA